MTLLVQLNHFIVSWNFDVDWFNWFKVVQLCEYKTTYCMCLCFEIRRKHQPEMLAAVKVEACNIKALTLPSCAMEVKCCSHSHP